MGKLNRNNIGWIIIGFLIGCVVTAVGLTLSKRVQPAPIVIEPPAPTATPGSIRVFVNGEVGAPGVYTLSYGAILEEAIEAAGGFTAEAETAVVNLAQSVSDGTQIYVPAKGEVAAEPAPTGSDPATAGAVTTSGAGASGDLININTVVAEALDTLPGVGPSTAQKIIDHRTANGPFASIEAIKDVSGIGDAKFNQIKDLITVGGE